MEGRIDAMVRVRPGGVPMGIRELTDPCVGTKKDFLTGEVSKVSGFTLNSKRLSLPHAYGVSRLRDHVDLMDCRVSGNYAYFPALPLPSDSFFPGQEYLFSSCAEMIRAGFHNSVLAVAPTGSGKTVLGLHIAATLGLATLVIVDRESLGHQWLEEIERHVGIPRADVGWFQAGKNTTEGKPISIAIIHSLAKRASAFPESFLLRFGTVIWDECHKVGAASFNLSTRLFPARYRLGLSATPERKDGCSNLVTNFFGPPFQPIGADALPCDVWVTRYAVPPAIRRGYAKTGNASRLVTALSKLPERNAILADTVSKGWRKGRNVIALSDRLAQLDEVASLLVARGVLESSIGFFTGKVSKAERDRARDECPVILATYQMAGDAINIPRLDFGIDMMPKGSGTQGIGRIRRPFPGKPTPVWFTFDDIGVPYLHNLTKKRLREFADSGATLRNA